MDTLISSSLDEICIHGTTGLTLKSLWSALPPPLSGSIKSALWKNLLLVPTLQFIQNDKPLVSSDPKIQLVEEAEKLNVKIVANNHLRDCFLGIGDSASTGNCELQRRTLERLAVSRTNGVTQNQLAKEFGRKGNNYFYTLKNLECRKLIVRQKALVKIKETVDCEGVENKNCSSVSTNLVYLSRYAKHLGAQQRIEINQGYDTDENESFASDVAVKDFLPAMRAICDKLEESNDKVLIVSDIKQSLGYTGTPGHRAWRNICHRLKDSGAIEDFDAKINGKVERCLRLLKPFPPKNFVNGGNDCPREQPKFGRRSQETEQLVELSIDHQVYDMIDAKKTEGATLIELCGRLGIRNKINYSRFNSLASRFGMHVQLENHQRTRAYRFFTPENSNSEESNAFLDKSKRNTSTLIESDCNVPCRSTECDSPDRLIGQDVLDRSMEPDAPERSTLALLEYNDSAIEVDSATYEKPNGKESEAELFHGPLGNDQTNHELLNPDKSPEFLNEPTASTSCAKLDLVSVERDGNAATSEAALAKLPDSGSYQAHPYLHLTVDGALREQRILERLQDEKFLLRVELHKWLVGLEKDKHTAMDRKTIDRLLSKLQREGHCRCVEVKLPAVTNCTSNRPIMVVLHPSVHNFPPELLGEIHDRLRSFEKEYRVQALSKLKTEQPIPVLTGVVRTHPRRNSEEQVIKAEAMRANGFELAKMVRAKLLHNFIWGHLSSLPRENDALSTGSSECMHKFFALESVLKVLPVELFLKVVGTAQKFKNIVEKSSKSMLLSDLPAEEYRLLMDTQATGRLSLTIDILRRLKLIRLIRNGCSEDGAETHTESFKHALELRPYIEEPLSVVATSNLKSLDLRPRIRHDFVLSNAEAVAVYWKTLEYCYAAADRRAASHAFPGSSVPEVFQPRFWTSVRFMSAYQRTELLKKIVRDDLKRKISCEECEQIAKDLNLSLQQVLQAYYGKHQQCLNSFQGVVNANGDYQVPKKRIPPSPSKRKRSGESSSRKRGKVGAGNEQLTEQVLMSQDTTQPFMEEQHPMKELGPNQNNKKYAEINQQASSESQSDRQRRFTWTDADDRQLLIQYTRQRAVFGATVQRIDWNKIPDLPAPPKLCSKRVASLKRNIQFRKALMNFCTMLSKRYAKHLQKTQSAYLNDSGNQVLVRSSTSVNRFSNGVENVEDTSVEEVHWDDFTDRSIKQAFDSVLLYKQMSKSQVFKELETASADFSNIDTNMESHKSEMVSSDAPNGNNLKDAHEIHGDSVQRSRRYRLHQKFIKCLIGESFVSSGLHKSLAVSNAVELLKLVFLSTSSTPELQNHLAETLRRYSEHDIFAAFSYLREKKIMIGGDGDQPFELSQQFLHNISKSLFPSNTGKRAAKFFGWLLEREKDLMEGGINLPVDLECGDIFQLSALLYSGELSISPSVPDEGVGEVEDVRSSKRKSEDVELCDGEKSKKLKSLADSELFLRREKGFPGLTVVLSRTSILAVDAVRLFTSAGSSGVPDQGEKSDDYLRQKLVSTSQSDGTLEIPNFDCIQPTVRWSSESPWEAMARYAEYLMLKPSDQEEPNVFGPEGFRTVYMAVQKAGDQGLSLEEVSKIVGENAFGHVIDVLQEFGCVLKVNAYNSVHIVDALYHSKYFLTPLVSAREDVDPHAALNSSEKSLELESVSQSGSQDAVDSSLLRDEIVRDHHVHKVTILNLPEEDVHSSEAQGSNVHEDSTENKVSSKQNGDIVTHKSSSNEVHMPILPWVNTNGSVNSVVYNGLVRRVLGIVMRNPGMLEDNIIHQIDVLNPQSCRSLLELMILDKHLIVRKIHQTVSTGPPSLLGTLFGSSFKESNSVYRKHFFANPTSASML